MRLKYIKLFFIFLSILILGCKEDKKEVPVKNTSSKNSIDYATGFTIDKTEGYTVVRVLQPWPNSKKEYTYAFIPKEKLASISYNKNNFDAVVITPIKKFVTTSTTHIPAIEALNGLDKLIGFPNTQYISSMPARKLIAQKKIKDLGKNETINTEITLELNPDAIVGFGIDNENSTYDILQKANIPVLYNGDWNEKTPLGKAEWIKFFGVLLGKEKEADSIFNTIKNEYNKVKELTTKATKKPKILSGALYKDVWYLPAGESWAAQFIKDANANYLWKATKGTGSLSLSIENILEKSQEADFWILPSQFTSYQEMENANSHYLEFTAFKNKKIYTIAATKGATGGLLYYELAPQRPDLVLKDLVYIFHPELVPNHSLYFFTPLQ